jgi:hypothetical protein
MPSRENLPHPKINIKILAHFSPPKNVSQRTTFYHAFHHNFTTKTPHRNTAFSKTPSKTPAKTRNPDLSGLHFF